VFCRKPLQTVLGMGAADWVLGLLSVSLILHSNTQSEGGGCENIDRRRQRAARRWRRDALRGV
jgi:hypothetical protein